MEKFTKDKFPEFKLLSKAIDVNTKVKNELQKLENEKKSEKSSFCNKLSILIKFNVSLLFFLYRNAILENLKKNFFTEKFSEFFNDNDGAFMLNKNNAPTLSTKLFEVISPEKREPKNQKNKTQETKKQTENEKIFSELKDFTNKKNKVQKMKTNFWKI